MSPFRTFRGGQPNQYGLGTLTHELLHKNMIGGGFRHDRSSDQLGNALRAVGVNPTNSWRQNGISRGIGSICF